MATKITIEIECEPGSAECGDCHCCEDAVEFQCAAFDCTLEVVEGKDEIVPLRCDACKSAEKATTKFDKLAATISDEVRRVADDAARRIAYAIHKVGCEARVYPPPRLAGGPAPLDLHPRDTELRLSRDHLSELLRELDSAVEKIRGCPVTGPLCHCENDE